MKLRELTTILINQAKFLQMTTDQQLEDLYNSIYSDAAKNDLLQHDISVSKVNLSKTVKIIQGTYFQFYVTPSEVILCNRYFSI